ncbi:hypothetical protein L6164_029961 [Bauhinia variegata]|uniref:Uncharacterized protein n=1 Tax=Bauhinia variegata TaxID=167791 RepID=A0ACB9LB90_BAUVA|nr:hypothetical protein L6164_029961 [Bauhinia variegata]
METTIYAIEMGSTADGDEEQHGGGGPENALQFISGYRAKLLNCSKLFPNQIATGIAEKANTERRQSDFGFIDAPKRNQVEQVNQCKISKLKWLDVLLNKTFFDLCESHPVRRNELNRYCVNCKVSACQYCVSSGAHRHHKILKIYRHVYKDVVSLGAIEKHIDCSEIQPYKCNKRLIIALNPLPHSGSTSKSETSCEICGRRLTDPGLHRYCSVSCKVRAVSSKTNDSAPPFILIQSRPEGKPENTPQTPKPLHRRKGIPRRAPFF